MQLLSLSPFELFEIVECFDIDKNLLNQKLLKLQLLYHPDSNNGTKQELGLLSSYVNQCYSLLASELERASFLASKWIDFDIKDDKSRFVVNQYYDALEEVFELQSLLNKNDVDAINIVKAKVLDSSISLAKTLVSKESALVNKDLIIKDIITLKYLGSKV